MFDPFASALDAIFNAPGSEAAEHISIYGVRTPKVRVIRGRNDQMVRLGESQIITGTHRVEIRKSQVPDLCHGDRLMIGEIGDDGAFVAKEELALTGEPIGDDENLTWTIGAETVDVSR